MQLVSACLVLACGGCDLLFQIQKVESTDAGRQTDAPRTPTDAYTYPVAGLVASYTFDGTDPYRDVTGHGNDAYCVTCPATVPGKRGSAMSFNGTQRLAAPSLELPQTTIALWFDAVPVLQEECPISKPLGTLNDDSWQVCLAPDTTNTTLELFASPATALYATATLSTGWHHAAMLFDGTSRVLVIDGVRVLSDSMGPVVYDSTPISIGADIDSAQPSVQFTGKLDEIKIFDHALSDMELATAAATP